MVRMTLAFKIGDIKMAVSGTQGLDCRGERSIVLALIAIACIVQIVCSQRISVRPTGRNININEGNEIYFQTSTVTMSKYGMHSKDQGQFIRNKNKTLHYLVAQWH